MSSPADFRYCEFGHLMTPNPTGVGWLPVAAYWGHVHHDDAVACARWERIGWPSQNVEVSR